jgi:hypothetical protein
MPSTAIRSFSYDKGRRQLQVTFVTGRRYLYFGVPQEEADAFRAASSKGCYFNFHIRHYPYRELEPAGD